MHQDMASPIPYVLFKAPRPELENVKFFLEIGIFYECREIDIKVTGIRDDKKVFNGWCMEGYPLYPAEIHIQYPCSDLEIQKHITSHYRAALAEKCFLIIAETDICLKIGDYVSPVINSSDPENHDLGEIPVIPEIFPTPILLPQ